MKTYTIGAYDVIGNPLEYLDYILEYQERSITKIADGVNIYRYTYNAGGVRTSKNINGVVTSYILEGSKILQEKKGSTTISYYYDSNGQITAFQYGSILYRYIKNLQNDIIGIADGNGNLVVEYYYDAYGKIIKVKDNSGFNLANLNPFRYKSYYFDSETGWYYLNSRYYNPLFGRFINADSIVMLLEGEFNLYRYCYNNPIAYIDTDGYAAFFQLDAHNDLMSIWSRLCGGGGSAGGSAMIIPKIDLPSGSYRNEYELGLKTGKYFETIDGAALAWAAKNSLLSARDNKERGAFILSTTYNDKKYYYLGITYRGFEGTVWNGFVAGRLLHTGSIEAFIHTHTAYSENYRYDLGPSDADMSLITKFGAKRGFIVDYYGNTYEYFGGSSFRDIYTPYPQNLKDRT